MTRSAHEHTLWSPASSKEPPTVMDVTCPVCGSTRVVFDMESDSRAARCSACEAQWEQRGSRQRNVRPGKLKGMPKGKRSGLAVFPIRE